MKTAGKIFSIVITNLLILSVAFWGFDIKTMTNLSTILFLLNGYWPGRSPKKLSFKFFCFVLSSFLFLTAVFIFHLFKNYDIITSKMVYALLRPLTIFITIFSISFFMGIIIRFIKNDKIRTTILFLLLGILISVNLNKFNHGLSGSISSVFYFYFSYLLVYKYRIKWYYVYGSLAFPYFLIYQLFGSLHALSISNFIFITFSIFMSFLYSVYRVGHQKTRQKTLLFSYSLVVVLYFVFLLNYTEYLYNKQSELSLNSTFNETFTDVNGAKISSLDFKGKITVLDLWSTSCSVCFKKFPDFDNFYQHNKENIIIYAVGLKMRNQSNETIQNVINKLNYNFPFLIAEKDFYYYKNRYKITGVPAIIIIDKNGKILYNKDLNTNPLIWVNNLQRMVNKLNFEN